PVAWDRSAAYDLQWPSAEAAVATLAPAEAEAYERLYPVALAMLHKRVPLAFTVQDQLGPAAFDQLRAGRHEGLGLDHYLSLFEDARLARAAGNSLGLAAATTALTTLLAFLVAFGVNRAGVPGRGLVRAATLTPLVSPPVIVSFAA